MHQRRQKARRRPSSAAALVHNLAAIRPGVVNNSGMDQKEVGSFASNRTRSPVCRPRRASMRSPARLAASVPKS